MSGVVSAGFVKTPAAAGEMIPPGEASRVVPRSLVLGDA